MWRRELMMSSESLTTLLDRNRSFADKFEAGALQIRPRLSTIILSCLDYRVDPAHFFGLGLGDALVLRNAGGIVTPAVIEDLAVLDGLAGGAQGPSAARLELVIVHHTDCGMARLVDPAIQQRVANRLGVSVEDVATKAIIDPAASIADDIERLREAPERQPSLSSQVFSMT